MDVKMSIFIFWILSVILSISNATKPIEHGEDKLDYLLSHLESTEDVVQQLLGRVEQLASDNEAQQQVILNQLNRIEHLEQCEFSQHQLNINLQRQLAVQRQRTSSLERFSERMKIIISSYVNKQRGSKDSGVKVKQIQPNSGINMAEENENRTQGPVATSKDIHSTRARIRRVENEQNVAFFATLSNQLQHAGVGQTFVFDRVVTNIANGYNNFNGNFIAPVSGTYVFSATLLSHYHNSAHAQFVKNGSPVSYMYVSGAEAGYDTSSQTIVLELLKGDDICISNNDADKSYNGDHYSTFSGFLLQPNVSDQVVLGRK
ncbi:EMILIN-1-A-like isoform X2 [Ruditapes philippinarum]|uniref:EMILIN-1-A-like isoform X2 n=1 Tax=Ruditapes philippinarum TaxID=129788 RepID=UPI00295A6B0D|nr:EMILIN-1-A-like isoform X2 [Ruditapes philippinarum]